MVARKRTARDVSAQKLYRVLRCIKYSVLASGHVSGLAGRIRESREQASSIQPRGFRFRSFHAAIFSLHFEAWEGCQGRKQSCFEADFLAKHRQERSRQINIDIYIDKH